jgi:hypothetical protein
MVPTVCPEKFDRSDNSSAAFVEHVTVLFDDKG